MNGMSGMCGMSGMSGMSTYDKWDEWVQLKFEYLSENKYFCKTMLAYTVQMDSIHGKNDKKSSDTVALKGSFCCESQRRGRTDYAVYSRKVLTKYTVVLSKLTYLVKSHG